MSVCLFLLFLLLNRHYWSECTKWVDDLHISVVQQVSGNSDPNAIEELQFMIQQSKGDMFGRKRDILTQRYNKLCNQLSVFKNTLPVSHCSQGKCEN